MHQPTMDFGYNPPTGPRSMEKIRPSFFSLDLEKTLNIASNGFKSIWVSDQFLVGMVFTVNSDTKFLCNPLQKLQ